MRSVTAYIISIVLTLIPYFLVSWGYVALTDSKPNSFWTVLGFLITLRAIFGIVEFIVGVIKWRLFGEKFAVQVILAVMKNNKFPMRDQRSDSFSHYLYWITEDYEPKPSPQRAAKEIQDVLLFFDEFTGWGLWSWRLTSAGEKALEIYSPQALVQKTQN